MSKRNIQYILAILVLLIANGYLFFTEGQSQTASFDDTRFSITDTSAIRSVTIHARETTVLLERNNTSWLLNDTYPVDPGFREVLFSMMTRIKVKRKVDAGGISRSGSVTIRLEDEALSFEFSTDALGTQTYFLQDGEAYLVEVPGYRDNVATIFQLTADQWRDRLVFDGSWRTIQKLSLQSESGSLLISFNSQFFEVEGVAPVDSSAVVDYLNQFQLFQANEMLSQGRFPELDSLKQTAPAAVLTIDDIKLEKPVIFNIYPAISGQSYQLVTNKEGTMMVLGSNRVNRILKSGSDFKAK